MPGSLRGRNDHFGRKVEQFVVGEDCNGRQMGKINVRKKADSCLIVTGRSLAFVGTADF